MAPAAVVEKAHQQEQKPPTPPKGPFDYKEVSFGAPGTYNESSELHGTGKHRPARYPNYLPTWEGDHKYSELEPFKHYEHGKSADPTFPDLLNHADVDDLTGNIGAEVKGVQLSKLSSEGKDQLALFVAQKKVVAFRDQDLADLPISEAVEFGKYFGRLHIHPTSPAPANHPEVHLVHRGADDTTAADFLKDRTNSTVWHSDVTYESQPPGTTFLYMLDGPMAGGDTMFENMAEAYNRLSTPFQKILEGLDAVHSSHEQAAVSADRGSVVRRSPVANVHPVVRTHPATGEKALFVNQQFTRKIIGFKKEESDALLKFLFDHIATGGDFQCRLRWRPNTVVVWDNRVTTHTATLDWKDGQRRHIARITPQAEKPTLRA